MDIDDFKDKCLTDIISDQVKSEEWYDLKEKQKLYGKEYKMKHKLFRGKFCPNCASKLEKNFMFRNKNEGTNHYVYKCHCGYKYADYFYED